jgi:DNA mismatch repair protein MSH6
MVILDELGRGTSTFDGTAIAHAVVHHLATVTKCRCLFATHYHSLVEEWGGERARSEHKGLVALGHMACVVDDAGAAGEGGAATKSITFLYNLTAGSSPKSFGINVAKLARLPEAVLRLAAAKSDAFERSLAASSQWQEAVALGKWLLSSATAGDDAGVLEAWTAASRLSVLE